MTRLLTRGCQSWLCRVLPDAYTGFSPRIPPTQVPVVRLLHGTAQNSPPSNNECSLATGEPAAPTPMTTATSVLVLILLTLAPASLPHETNLSSQRSEEGPAVPAALVRRAIQNREAAAKTHRPLRYLLRKTDDHRDTTKDIIETDQGDVARLIAINNQPLTAEANQAELDRLNTLANHPEIQEHRHQREQKDADRVNRLMRLLPDAFLYRDQGTSPCPTGAGTCHHLTFSPNPSFEPPDVEANIFRGLAGERLDRSSPGAPDPPRRPRHRQRRFRLGHPGQARQRGNHPARTIRHRQPRLGTHHPEAEPDRQGLDAQVAEYPADGASHPFLPTFRPAWTIARRSSFCRVAFHHKMKKFMIETT